MPIYFRFGTLSALKLQIQFVRTYFNLGSADAFLAALVKLKALSLQDLASLLQTPSGTRLIDSAREGISADVINDFCSVQHYGTLITASNNNTTAKTQLPQPPSPSYTATVTHTLVDLILQSLKISQAQKATLKFKIVSESISVTRRFLFSFWTTLTCTFRRS